MPETAQERFLLFTAAPVFGWLMCYWRGWAWQLCPECTWWTVSADPAEMEHATFQHITGHARA